jgi:hypothetical protein
MSEPNWTALQRDHEYRVERERNRRSEDSYYLDDPQEWAWDDPTVIQGKLENRFKRGAWVDER